MIGTLELHKSQGKIQHVGLSNFSAEQIESAACIAPIAAVECGYNLLDRQQNQAVVDTCIRNDIPVWCYGVLAQGLFSGKYGSRHNFPKHDRRSRLRHFREGEVGRTQDLVSELTAIASQRDASPSQIAIQLALQQPGVRTAIIGANNDQQITDNCAAASIELTREEADRLTRIADAVAGRAK